MDFKGRTATNKAIPTKAWWNPPNVAAHAMTPDPLPFESVELELHKGACGLGGGQGGVWRLPPVSLSC